MKRCLNIRFLGIMVLLLFAFPLGDRSLVNAAPIKSVKGVYSLTLFQSCIASLNVPAFDPSDNFRRVANGGGPNTFSIAGQITYNGDGTGTVSRRQLILIEPAKASGAFPLFQADVTCDVSYTVDANGNIRHEENNCAGPILQGTPGSPNETVTQSQIVLLGTLHNGGKLILFNDTSPYVETITFDMPPRTGERICNRSGTAFRVTEKVPN